MNATTDQILTLFPGAAKRPGAPGNRARGGAEAKRAGKEFEHLILASCRDAEGQVMNLEQIHNFARPTVRSEKRFMPYPKPGRWEMVKVFTNVQVASPWDFSGSVCGSGRGVFLDAKNLGDGYASFPVNNDAVVKLHQISALLKQEEAGAIAGFLVRCIRMNDYRFCWASQAYTWREKGVPLQWRDEAWDVLGPVREGYGVPLRKLLELT